MLTAALATRTDQTGSPIYFPTTSTACRESGGHRQLIAAGLGTSAT